MAQNTIKRDIHFYRVDCGFKPNGELKVFDPTPTFEYVKKLGFKDGSNYCEDEGKSLGCWVSSTNEPCKVVLGNIRKDDLPLIEYRGELSPLEIPENAGLLEQTHIVFFEDNIVGCDFNYYGPRISRLAFYLSAKAIGHSPEYISFNPILQRDVYKRLEKFEHIKMLNLKVRAPYVDTIAHVNDSLGDSLRAALRAGGDDDFDVELVLQATRNSSGPLSDRLFQSVKSLSKRPNIRDDIKTFKVKGYNSDTQNIVELDLLSDKLIIKKEISKINPKSKGLISSSAFKAITLAYEEIKDEIRQSPSVIL